ncbi:hypothetical protein M4914_22515 [Streptomyces somaliensis DSM 40738]|uniref:CU044_2847 family protein n=1 Tax=Streptomyces somaliensis TaxID=78355 RepID=UPI0021C46477|nr:CU044_2847 family protein [Streptomyces somaliensis]MCQ0025433.1 hypothetical protein [Streptomyces somaliensis DSM 40738]
MSRLITFEVGDGDGTAVFEVDDGLVPVGPEGFPGESVAGRARVSLQEALDELGPALAHVFGALRRLGPQEVVVDFGLKVGGEGGIVVAKGTTEVNFAVRLLWRRDRAPLADAEADGRTGTGVRAGAGGE